jgi:hypothetical protein
MLQQPQPEDIVIATGEQQTTGASTVEVWVPVSRGASSRMSMIWPTPAYF